jgi:hypothetical protein
MNWLEEEIVNKQFQMAKLRIQWKDIPTDGMVEVLVTKKKKKKVEWWNVHKFPTQELYQEWFDWGKKRLEESGDKTRTDTWKKLI